MTKERTKATAATKAGMDEKTARKYIQLGKLPSEIEKAHTWRTRKDPFEKVWKSLKSKLEINPGLEAKTLFEDLQRQYPGRFEDGQLRTLQRKIKRWRALEGPPKEVFFEQEHRPGELCQSDFTRTKKLSITISGQPFEHLLYHFVLPYSNWEAVSVCFSESFESLSDGLQNALWELGGVPSAHQTDRMSTAVHKTDHPEEFTQRYSALLRHYRLEGRKIRARKANENGDVEQRHNRLKRAMDQALMLRSSRDFADRTEYDSFLKTLVQQLNLGRKKRLAEELRVLRQLPQRRLAAYKPVDVRVSSGSTIRVSKNVYSVDSRLIGEMVRIRQHSEHLELWYAQKCLEKIPRLRGGGRHYIQYRHIIDWLVRKPGAFENYRYKKDLFPSSLFRMAYDGLKTQYPKLKADKEYLEILNLAAKEGEQLVEQALECLSELGGAVDSDDVCYVVQNWKSAPKPSPRVSIGPVDLGAYDKLLAEKEAVLWPSN